MYCFCTLKSVKVAWLFGAPTWAPTDWIGLTIPSPSVVNLNHVTPASRPAAHNLSLTSLKLRHMWQMAHTPTLIRPVKTDGNTLGRERSADNLGSHYTTQAITVSLSLSLSPAQQVMMTSSVLMFSSSECAKREPVVMVTLALNWPSYRLAFLHVSSFPTGIFFSLLLVHLHKSLAHSGHYVELM